MRKGLPQGFVIFGTLAHKILVLLHQLGDQCHSDMVAELEVGESHMGTIIQRLADYRYIYPAGKMHTYDTGMKTQMLWSLKYRKPSDQKQYRRATPAERMRRRREALKARAATSVFNLDKQSYRLLRSMAPNENSHE